MEITDFFRETKGLFILIHVVSVIIGMGAALISDIFFTLFSRDRLLEPRELKVLNTLSYIVWIGLALIIVSGLGIFLSDPLTYASSPKFLSKMSIVLILSLNGYILHRFIKPHLKLPAFLETTRRYRARTVAFACGAISLISWICAFVLALLKNVPWNYTQFMGLYVLILALAVPCAILLERWKFSR